MAEPHVVIVGGGFGGLYAARALDRTPVRVTLLDRQNHHLFQPLLYQVATASLNPSDIGIPLRYVLRGQRNATVLLAEVASIDLATKTLTLSDDETLGYDYLVLATGATHSYFGNDQWAPHAPGLKSLEDAVELRQRFLLAFEAAEREDDPDRRKALLTFVVIGAGPTGAEMAGSMAEIARRGMAMNFRRIDTREARVILVEGVDRVLPSYAPELSAKARAQLESIGVEVRTGSRVTAIDEGHVTLGTETIATRNVVWAAGVAGSPLARTLGVPLDRVGRVKVDEFLSVAGHPEVFVVGDLAYREQDGKPLPGVCQGGIQGGRYAARQIVRSVFNEGREPYRYDDKGSMATLGRNAAIAEIYGTKLSGFLAWLAWLLIHIAFLIGFRNRVFVMASWAWSYVNFHRGVRLITRKVPPTLLSYDDDPSRPPPEPTAP